jgi:hypothetical protein
MGREPKGTNRSRLAQRDAKPRELAASTERGMEQLATRRWSIAAFGVTILLSAFLLFQVQPLVSKAILPWFGGCAAVWTTCMLFFQVVLFAGYVYAHLLQQWLPPRRQIAFHLGLAVVAFLLLPIAPSDYWKPTNESNPTWQILVLLTATVGLPYFALSATSPLVQAWFSAAHPGRSPYRLYALSNVGSLAALLSYPFVFEPAFNLKTQSLLWSGAFVAYAAMCAVVLVGLWKAAGARGQSAEVGCQASEAVGTATRPTWLDRFRWMALPACASLMLLAATNHVCQNVAVVPFLWVVPLALYLLSFIITFDHARWYVRPLWAAGALLALMGAAAHDFNQLSNDVKYPLGLIQELTLYLGAMFCVCMVCHGELARLKPGPRYLTEFYLLISAGGALGGLLVAIAAPLMFKTYFEWPIGVAVSAVLSAGVLIVPRWTTGHDAPQTQSGKGTKQAVARPPRARRKSKAAVEPASFRNRGARASRMPWIIRGGALACVSVSALLYLSFWMLCAYYDLDHARDFFGAVTVSDLYSGDPEKHIHRLNNGQIVHGCQFVDPARRSWPTMYYGESSGVGHAIRCLQKSGPVRVGGIGLGVGTLATYARPGDEFRFYEINPDVEQMARKHFTYLADCRGKCGVKLGDARLSLEAENRSEPQRKFDLLVLDAFSGDAIPTHLLTREAFAIYRKRLTPGGVIAAHVSNNYLRLPPVVRRLAEESDMKVSRIADAGDMSRMVAASVWILATDNESFLEANPSDPADWGSDDCPAPLWTDQYSNLFQILKMPGSDADYKPTRND